ncbi:MFS transporter [Nonomuraea sp. LPB2021202275-12-8]|uniref:MFS transporter n=1 Tax=Nonomuraea sp. LPB2021202275-12-8 TaxID=3120159 RepID=UPI00300C9F9E
MTVTALPAPAAVRVTPQAPSRKWLGLFAILSADLLNLLDSTVGNVASPAIRADLGGSMATMQWIVAGYTLAMAVGLLTGGRLGDMFGRKRMMMVGVVGFLVASLACGLAYSPESLIAARVLQGGFGALMVPQTFGLIRDLFGDSTGKAFAALGPVIGLATILGPIVAALLVEADLFGTGWRAIFLINLPLGAFALAVGWKVLPAKPPAARGTRLDGAGAMLAAVGMTMLVVPLVQGHELGWPTWTLVMLAASVPVLAVFVLHQLRRSRTGRTPLVELSVFAKRSYASGVAFVVAFFGAITGFSLVVALFLQIGLKYSPLEAGLAMIGWAVGAFAGSAIGGTLMNRLGRHLLHIGLAMMTAGLVTLYGVFDTVGAALDGWDLTPALVVYGMGMGMIFVPLFDIVVGGLRDHEVGSASGMLAAFEQLGASLGVAALGTLFFSVAGSQGFLDACMRVTLVAIALTAVTFGLGFLLPKRARQARH